MKEEKKKVGRPKNTYGKETLLNHKKSFRLDKNVVFDKNIDVIVMVTIMLIICFLILHFGIR